MIEIKIEGNIASDLCKLQAELNNPQKDKQVRMKLKSGREVSYGYVDFGTLIDLLREPLSKHGFSIVQSPYSEDGILGIETLLIHKDGGYLRGRFGTKYNGNSAQDAGSQITYYRRYSMLSMLNLAQEDDDGANASKERFSSSSETLTEKHFGAMFYKVKDSGASIDDFNNIVKPNIEYKQYKWLMDNFSKDNFEMAVGKIKNQG